MNKSTTTLSLDTSSTRTGWAFFVNKIYNQSGIVDLTTKENKKLSSDDRIEKMCLNIFDLIKKFHPDIIVIEKLTVSRNMNTVRVLSKIIGTVYAYALQNKIRYVELEASQWRSYLHMQKRGRKRDEYKKLSIQHAKIVANKDITDDEADAICIGQGFLKMNNVYMGN